MTLRSLFAIGVLVTGALCSAQPGTQIRTFPSPSAVNGLAFANDSLWGATFLATPPLLYEFDRKTGAVLTTVQSSYTFPFGMGFDSKRNQLVVTSASHGTVARLDASGQVTTSFATPTGLPVGVAYDAKRDAYWVADWSADQLHAMDATSGAVLRSPFDLTSISATRVADLGFSDENDLVVLVDRDRNAAFLLTAADPPTLRGQFPLAAMTSNARGCAIDPRTQTLYTNDGGSAVFEVDLGLPRVGSADQVSVGTTLSINWIATGSPNRAYAAAASFLEGRLPLGSRQFPLRLDPLFTLSQQLPALFPGFVGTLDSAGTASGAVVVPAVPTLAGIPFYVAFVTLAPQSPLGIGDISGAAKISIVP